MPAGSMFLRSGLGAVLHGMALQCSMAWSAGAGVWTWGGLVCTVVVVVLCLKGIQEHDDSSVHSKLGLFCDMCILCLTL